MMETRCQPRNEIFGNENILFPNNASFPHCGYLFPHLHRVIHISVIPTFLFRIPAGCHSQNDNSPRGGPPFPPPLPRWRCTRAARRRHAHILYKNLRICHGPVAPAIRPCDAHNTLSSRTCRALGHAIGHAATTGWDIEI